ncbi:response regulator [Virgibacillus chiguensis]|uniref:Two-component system, CitB family, response regulator DctR n=1 Tax=Virgibacillus chiguensis TaxID=411959 RepID=A0A1M5RM40_9BACI|nr:response regulator [Virgibacillus chiguensis]SHH27295.1 two-component system, CitB family, response regulator DctR [Virgibacillus chiguensis]
MCKNTEVKVVIIEDDPMVQEVNKKMVEKVNGFIVVATARDGKTGVEHCQIYQPNLVLLDIYMPEQDGIQTIKALRHHNINVEVIVISAAEDREMVRNMMQHGAFDYLIKPFKYSRLVEALNKYRDYHLHFYGNDSVDQEMIDMWINKRSEANYKANALPKGLNKQTLQQITNLLERKNSSISADEAASCIGISRVTARRYLDYLEKGGAVEIVLQYGTVGRPVNRYQLMRKVNKNSS